MPLTLAMLTRRDRASGTGPSSAPRPSPAPGPSPVARGELAEALARQLGVEVLAVGADQPADLVWLDTADPEDVADARSAHPRAGLLVTLGRSSRADDVVRAFALGADLVQRDEGPALAVASLAALARRARRPQARAG